MHSGKLLRVLLISASLALLIVGSALAQQIRYPNFANLNDVANLQRNGNPTTKTASWQGVKVLRLSDGADPRNLGHLEASSTYFKLQQPVTMGFTTYFSFQLHNPTTSIGPGEGFSFLIQNSTSVDTSMGATGSGMTALGAGGSSSGVGALGYAGIPNSLAVEFDVSQNAWDPTSNHVAVQSCGSNPDTPVHLPGTYTIGNNTNVTSCLVNPNGITSNIPTLANNVTHYAVIEYTPPVGSNPFGTLMVWVDPVFIEGTHTAKSPPVINIPYNIAALGLTSGSAWVGFTASQSSKATVQDIFEWEFTPHTPTVVQQQIPNDGSVNTFTFGGHDATVQYPAGVNQDGTLFMSVLATPIDKGTFYRSRLMNTQFKNEICVTYLETGGNCIVYSITCQKIVNGVMTQVDCPNEIGTQNVIALTTSYYTSDGITLDNADFLKTDPIGSNNWISICNPPDFNPPCYDPNTFDGTTAGSGKNLSDIVATYAPLQTHPGHGGNQNVAKPAKQVLIGPGR